jgi:TM2 domain-containing membrane protein YozV
MSDSASNAPTPPSHAAQPPLPPLPPAHSPPIAASPAGQRVQNWGNRAWRAFGATPWWRLVLGGLIVIIGAILLAIPFDSFRIANKIRSQAAKDALRTSLQHEVLERARGGLLIARSLAMGDEQVAEIDSAIAEIDREISKPIGSERFEGSLNELQSKIDAQRAKRNEALQRLNDAATKLAQGKEDNKIDLAETIREITDEIESLNETLVALEEQRIEKEAQRTEQEAERAAREAERAAEEASRRSATPPRTQKSPNAPGAPSAPKAAPAPIAPLAPIKSSGGVDKRDQGTVTTIDVGGASLKVTTVDGKVKVTAGEGGQESVIATVDVSKLAPKVKVTNKDGETSKIDVDLFGRKVLVLEDAKSDVKTIGAIGFQPDEPSAALIRETINRDVQKFLIAGTATLVLTILFFFMLIARSFAGRAARGEQRAVIAESRERTESHARQLAEARLTLMRAQVEPHFLFNTLAHVQALQEIDPPQASTMLEQLIAYLRASMPSMRDTKSTLGREIDVVRAYLELLKIRMGDRLKFFVNVPADMNDTSLPPTMIATLVENAIKHGLEPKKEGGSIAVQVRKLEATAEHPERMEVLVADDGLGFGAADTQGTGVGLANTRERLKMLYGSQAELAVEPNAPTGVRAIIRVPLVMPETIDEAHDELALNGSSANVSPFTIQTVALLALCFGWLGVHRFYIGRARTGFMQAALGMLSLLSSGVPVFVVPLVIWVVLDMVWVITREFRDAHGRRIMRRDARDRRAYSATQSFKKPRAANVSESSRGIALLLAVPLGWTGAHRFYVGRVGTGLAMLLTLGGLGLWWLIDIVMVACGQLKDMDGKWVNEWE